MLRNVGDSADSLHSLLRGGQAVGLRTTNVGVPGGIL